MRRAPAFSPLLLLLGLALASTVTAAAAPPTAGSGARTNVVRARLTANP